MKMQDTHFINKQTNFLARVVLIHTASLINTEKLLSLSSCREKHVAFTWTRNKQQPKV